MVLQFVTSERGNPMLLYNGFLHKKERTIGNKTIWKCADYHKNRCPGRVHTVQEEVVRSTSHAHVPDAAKVHAKRTIANMKEMAKQVESSTQAILANVSAELPPAVSAQLPSVSVLKRTIQRTRKVLENVPADPRNLTELQLPEEYKNIDGELFLQFDSGPGDDRILLFSTQRSLDFMNNCNRWYADGTFSSSPKLFCQLYTIHGVQYSNVIPTVFALLPNKSQATYVRFLEALNTIKPNLRPVSIMVDFERAAINAFMQQFPQSTIRGCFFHLCQCVWRQIQQAGLQGRYSEDAEFALQLRLLSALAFVPPNDVNDAYEQLLGSDFYVENENLLVPLLNYFEDTWIGRLDRRGHRRSPLYPVRLWNVYDLVAEDIPRTNNAIEGWHNSFSSILNAAHPSIWKFIKALRKEESLNRLKIEQLIAGHEQPRKKIYRDTAERLQRVVADYANRPIVEYLRGIAYNFQMQL